MDGDKVFADFRPAKLDATYRWIITNFPPYRTIGDVRHVYVDLNMKGQSD